MAGSRLVTASCCSASRCAAPRCHRRGPRCRSEKEDAQDGRACVRNALLSRRGHAQRMCRRDMSAFTRRASQPASQPAQSERSLAPSTCCLRRSRRCPARSHCRTARACFPPPTGRASCRRAGRTPWAACPRRRLQQRRHLPAWPRPRRETEPRCRRWKPGVTPSPPRRVQAQARHRSPRRDRRPQRRSRLRLLQPRRRQGQAATWRPGACLHPRPA